MRKLFLSLCLLFSLTLSGCAALDTVLTKVDDNRLVLQYSMMRLIDEDVDKANEVLRISRAVQGAVASWQTLTVAQLVAEAETHIPWQKMHPADVMLVKAFLPDVAASLTAGVEDGKLDPNARLRLDAVFSWIETAAYMSGATQ